MPGSTSLTQTYRWNLCELCLPFWGKSLHSQKPRIYFTYLQRGLLSLYAAIKKNQNYEYDTNWNWSCKKMMIFIIYILISIYYIFLQFTYLTCINSFKTYSLYLIWEYCKGPNSTVIAKKNLKLIFFNTFKTMLETE